MPGGPIQWLRFFEGRGLVAEADKYLVIGARLHVKLSGVLDKEAVARESAGMLSALTSNVKQVLIETSAVTACPEAARPDLVGLQKALSAGGRRTAWVDERAVFRGMALWVMHLASDPVGKAVATMSQAETWLASNEQRESVASKKAVGR